MMSTLSYPIVSQSSTLPIMTASSYEAEEQHHNDDHMVFDESFDGTSSDDHDEEHGVDEDFLNKLYLIADHESEDCIRTAIPANMDDDDYHLTAYEHHDDDAHMIEDDDDSVNDSISVDASSCSGISCNANNKNNGSSSSSSPSYSLVAPNSNVDGMVNAYFVVDPINNVVFFPKQTISCQVGERIETVEFGPMFLPNFDINSIHEMNSSR